MIKKLFCALFALLFICITLCACNDNKKETNTSKESEKTISDTNNSENISNNTFAQDGFISSDALIIKEGNYELHTMSANYIGEEAAKTAWWYEYTTTDQNPCDFSVWMPSDVNTMTTLQVLVGVINLKETPQTFSDRVDSALFNNDKKVDKNTNITIMQVNPKQFTTDGYQVPSTLAVPIDKGQEGKIAFMIDLNKDLLKSKSLILKFKIDEDEYKIDLSSNMKERTI